MLTSQVIADLQGYMGNEPLLIKVEKRLYSLKEVSFTNVSGRPILVADHEVTIPNKLMYEWVFPADLDVGDMIEGQYGKLTVIIKNSEIVVLRRGVVVVKANGDYGTEFVDITIPATSTQKYKYIGRAPTCKEEIK
jgi:hypothetical protein